MSSQNSDWATAWGSREDAKLRLDELNDRQSSGDTLLQEEIEEIDQLNAGFYTDELHVQIRQGEPLTPEQVDEYNRAKNTLQGSSAQNQPCKGILDNFNFKDSIKKLGSAIGNTLKGIVKSVIDQAASVVDQVTSLVSQTIDLAKSTIDDTVDSATKLAKSPGSILKKITGGILDTVKSVEDEIFKQINKLKCVEKYTDETASVTKSVDTNVQTALKQRSPKKRKQIKEDPQLKEEFTNEVTIDIKQDVSASTQASIITDLKEEENNSNNLVSSVNPDIASKRDIDIEESNTTVSDTTSNTQATTSADSSITFASASSVELVSVDRLKAIYKISTGETFEAYFGTRGNVIYTIPAGAEQYISNL